MPKAPKGTLKRLTPMSFKTFPSIKRKLIKLAALGNRSISREMERLIKDAPLEG